MTKIQNKLFELSDAEYKAFHCKLMPTVSPQKVIGVRTPALRRLACEIYRQGNYDSFLKDLPHEYYEENNLHAFLIEKIKDYDLCIAALCEFLPYVDNWATCDCMSPKLFSENTDRLYEQIKAWIKSEHTYTVRYGVKTLMSLYSKEKFQSEHIELIADIRSEEYYVKMAVAWYFATLLAFHYDEALGVLQNKRLNKWTHNKTVQKAMESYRVSEEHKKELKKLRI